MSIKVSEHILSLDDSILAVSLFSNQFHIIERAAKPGFESRFRISPDMKDSGPSHAAAMYVITKLLQDRFGRVEKITVDHQDAKLMLLALDNDGGGFVGLVLKKMVNSDYLALHISRIVEESTSEVDSLA